MARIKARFLYNHRRQHASLVFDEGIDDYGFIGITSKQYTHGVKNIPLPQNVEKGKTFTTYIRPNPMRDHKSVFSKHKRKLVIGNKNRYWFKKVMKKPYIK